MTPLRRFAASPQGDAPFGPAKPVLWVPWVGHALRRGLPCPSLRALALCTELLNC